MGIPHHTRSTGSLQDLTHASRDIRRNLLSNRKVVLFVVAMVLFLVVLQNMLAGDILRLDYYAYRLIVVRMRRAWLTPIMQSISELALPAVLVVMLLAVQAFAPGRRPGLCAAGNLVGIVLLNQVFKFLVQRPRPEGFRLIAESGYSFPSGHSMVAMGFYGLLAWMAWRYEKDPTVRRLSVAGFALIVALVGISRVYLGVHYASDVIAGFCLALAWLALYITVVAPLLLPEAKTDLGADETALMGKADT
ncbi:MAG: phosphatase PAP2 family protein [Acidobacteriota bacterium]|nr:phosphatase PAP2 family protein [Acidobacteriota bacterium]